MQSFKVKIEEKKSIFSKSANISLHKYNIQKCEYWILWDFVVTIFTIVNIGFMQVNIRTFFNMGKYPLFVYLIKLWIMTICQIFKIENLDENIVADRTS